VRIFLTIMLTGLIGLATLTGAEARERRRPLVTPSEIAVGIDVEDGYDQSDDQDYGNAQLAQQDSDYGIPPSEAAAIARDAVPGARVVGVRLLSNGYYAVTLRAKGSVTRVLVNARDGSIR
jgi:uncharacterized membrane protein YkoI